MNDETEQASFLQVQEPNPQIKGTVNILRVLNSVN